MVKNEYAKVWGHMDNQFLILVVNINWFFFLWGLKNHKTDKINEYRQIS